MNLRFLLNEKDEKDGSPVKKRKWDSFSLHPAFVEPKETLSSTTTTTDSFAKVNEEAPTSNKSPSPILINIESLSKSDSVLLAKFIQENSQHGPNYFARSKVFYYNGVGFALSHGLLTRPCSSDSSGCHIEIIDHENVLGQGNSGKIYASKGTINIINETAEFTPQSVNVIKEEYHQNESQPERKNEFQYSPVHLQMKKPAVFFISPQCAVSFTVIKRIDGNTLLDVIHKSILDFNVDNLLQLCIDLTDALQLQVHDYDIIHRDIKLENIMIYKLMVTIIDFGLCKKNGTSDEDEFAGTPGYIPPEACSQGASGNEPAEYISTETRDIYALATVFFLLWGGCLDQIENYLFHKEKNENLVLPRLPDISLTHHGELQQLINMMRHPNQAVRPTTEAITFTLHKIRMERKQAALSIEKQSEVEMAFNAAISLKTKVLNKLAKTNIAIDNPTQLDRLATAFFQSIEDFKDRSCQVTEFIEALNIKALQGITSQDALIINIGNTIDTFKEHLAQLHELKMQAKKYGPKNCLLMKIENTLIKLTKYKLNFDNIARLTHKLEIKLSKLTQLIETYEKSSHERRTYPNNPSTRKDEFSMHFFSSNESCVMSNNNNKADDKRLTSTR